MSKRNRNPLFVLPYIDRLKSVFDSLVFRSITLFLFHISSIFLCAIKPKKSTKRKVNFWFSIMRNLAKHLVGSKLKCTLRPLWVNYLDSHQRNLQRRDGRMVYVNIQSCFKTMPILSGTTSKDVAVAMHNIFVHQNG